MQKPNIIPIQEQQFQKFLKAEYESFSDKDMVEHLLSRDPLFTEYFLYHKAYPLLKSYYNYFGHGALLGYSLFDDFVLDFYLEFMSPQKKNGQDTPCSKLSSFEGRCSLFYWMKIVCYHFCSQKAKQHDRSLPLSTDLEIIDPIDDRNICGSAPCTENKDIFACEDLDKILSMMPNPKYAFIIRELAINQLSEKELAEQMGENKYFYVMVKRARKQFDLIQQKEGLYNV